SGITATARGSCCRVTMGAFTRFLHIGQTSLTRTRKSSSVEGAPFSVSRTCWISPAFWLGWVGARRGRCPTMCKANSAAGVSINVPQRSQHVATAADYVLYVSLCRRNYSLDKLLLGGVFILTDM